MADRLELRFTATLDDKQFEAELRKAVTDIESKIPAAKIKLQVDDTLSQKAVTDGTKAFKLYRDAADNVYKIVTQTTNAKKQLVTTTYNLEKETGKFVKAQSMVVESMDKTHAGAIRLNDAYDRQKLSQKLLLIQLKQYTTTHKAFIERGGYSKQFTDLEQSIRNLQPTNENFKKQIGTMGAKFKDLKANVSGVKQEMLESSRYTNIFGQNLLEAGKKFAGNKTSAYVQKCA